MSAETASNTDMMCVYVRLLGEGTLVFRPAKATAIGSETVRLLVPDDYDPVDEEWEFKPGLVVRVERRVLGGESVYVAVSTAE